MTTGQPIHDDLQGFGLAARRAVVAAHEEARASSHERVGTEHLLLAVLADEELAPVLRDAGAPAAAVRRKVAEAVPAGRGDARHGAPLPRSARCARAIGRAARFARADGAELVGAQHLLLGVLDVEGTAGQVLRGLGVDLERLRESLRSQAAPPPPEDQPKPAEHAPEPQAPPPKCPSCDTPLTSGVAEHAVEVQGRGTTVTVIACNTCGAALGTV